ncbi:hypothetical protein TREES_T100012318 [Tupaia chinensis]|uniref:Uncharacterized protein n=1 Tax=Tupaia chinensis TaxID=246437 RepID=L9JFH2_TUPCH|nr:hypothetical protein TREES_T100012318 [Tupaia chinensis]
MLLAPFLSDSQSPQQLGVNIVNTTEGKQLHGTPCPGRRRLLRLVLQMFACAGARFPDVGHLCSQEWDRIPFA